MFDVITFGTAVWDAFMEIEPKFIKKDERVVSGRGYLFNMGSKIDVPGMRFAFGGGGVNTGTTFARQGFRTAYCGMVGDDIPGREVAEHLKRVGISTDFVSFTQEKATNNSVVLNAKGKDRVILVYRGASELMTKNNVEWDKISAKLFYLAPLSGKLSSLTDEIISFAKKNNVTIAANLGHSQLKMEKTRLKKLIAGIDVLILNKEESALLTGVNYANEEKIIKKMALMHQGVNVITKGKEGAAVTFEGKIFEANLKNFKVADVTGAGDAFASGFMSGMLSSQNDIEYSMKLALVNAKHCLSIRGSDKLLAKEDNYLVGQENIKVKVRNLN